jgi:hypothetical protein
MKKNNNEIRIGLVGTSASHFPVETAKNNLNRIASAIPVSKESIIGPYLVIETKDSEKVAKELQSQDISFIRASSRVQRNQMTVFIVSK